MITHKEVGALRKRFEAWISAPPYERSVDRVPNDPTQYAWPNQYRDINTQTAWEAWCEASGMSGPEDDVREFMLKAGQKCPATPTMPGPEVCQLRTDLIHEELAELEDSLGDGDLVEAYDAILDLLVVTIGTAIACGMKLQPGWDEVHRSNMTKFLDGHRREDGKFMKGPSWCPPNLAPILEAQAPK